MERLIEKTFDQDLSKIIGLTWLPWIGNNFKNNNRRLLIVGESHYALGADDAEYQKRFKEATDDKFLTRECIYESPICGDWRNNTFDNIHRVLLRTNDFDKELLWQQVVFYNFIPRLMDYRVKERPTWMDFYSSWKTFVDMVKIIKPTDCIFIGVSASNSFNQAMDELRLNYSPVKWLEGIGTAYARTATLEINESEIKLSFIQHASQMFSWSRWNTFLERENREVLSSIRNLVFPKETVVPEEVIEQVEQVYKTIDVPLYLTHKPIIACNYSEYTNADDDAKFLSIGHAQYDYDSASIKIFRHTGEKWSRQSEELPINRVGDIALLLLSAINKVYKPNFEHSILNEVTIKEEELEFLKDEIESNKERIKTSFLEIKRLLNVIDIENL